MALYKNGAFIEDRWRALPDGEAAPVSGHVVFPFDWWLEERHAFDGSNVPLGVRIEPGARLEEIAEDIKRFSVIELFFPKYVDGRAFSLARLLRDRYGYTGEIRAVGEVLADQIQLMRRSGFDAFEITDPVTEKALREGRVPGVSHFYQPGLGAEKPVGARPWTRQSAGV
jgi:phosphoadenosine phosphosulfate reductase